MKVSDYIAETLRDAGVTKVFGFQGSNITHMINSVYMTEGMEYIQTHHEQAAAFAACACSEITGNPGCALSSSGPGAINMISGIVNAWFDSIPVVFLTGQLNSKALSPDRNYRQHGFQEFDIVSTVRHFTKYAVTLLDPASVKFHLEKALWSAKSGRPGGVLLDIPHNLQAADIDIDSLTGFYPDEEVPLSPEEPDIQKILHLLDDAVKPLVLVGGGAGELRDSSPFIHFISEFALPVVASLRGLDILSHDSEHFFGFIGSYGNRYANIAVSECDLLIVLGSRLDFRQIGDNPSEFAKNARIVHVDIDSTELGHNIVPDIPVHSSCGTFIASLLSSAGGIKKTRKAWFGRLNELKERYPSFSLEDAKTLPNELIYTASRFFKGNDIITGDVGQNQMWTAQSSFLKNSMRLLNSAGLGSMGYSLPAAIGAAEASPGSRVLCVSGDGGIQMNIQELATVRRRNLPVKIMVMNNRSLGLIRTYQRIVFGNAVGSVEGFGSPNYAQIAEGYGINYASACNPDDIRRLEPLFTDDEPLLVEIKLSSDTEVHPEPAYQKPVYIQAPLLEEQP